MERWRCCDGRAHHRMRSNCRKWEYVCVKLNGVDPAVPSHIGCNVNIDSATGEPVKNPQHAKFQYKYFQFFALLPFCCIFLLVFSLRQFWGFSAPEREASNKGERISNAHKQQINAINRVEKIYDFTVNTRYMARPNLIQTTTTPKQCMVFVWDVSTGSHRNRYGW